MDLGIVYRDGFAAVILYDLVGGCRRRCVMVAAGSPGAQNAVTTARSLVSALLVRRQHLRPRGLV